MIPEPTEALLPCPFCGSEVVEEVGRVGHPIDCDNGCPLLYNAFGVDEWNTREPEAGKLREVLEFGDAGDALDYALDHLRDSFEIMDFLECWREGRLTDWPGYIHWLEVQRKGAAEAALSRNQGR